MAKNSKTPMSGTNPPHSGAKVPAGGFGPNDSTDARETIARRLAAGSRVTLPNGETVVYAQNDSERLPDAEQLYRDFIASREGEEG